MPKITSITITKNEAEDIGKCLDSLAILRRTHRRQLRQHRQYGRDCARKGRERRLSRMDRIWAAKELRPDASNWRLDLLARCRRGGHPGTGGRGEAGSPIRRCRWLPDLTPVVVLRSADAAFGLASGLRAPPVPPQQGPLGGRDEPRSRRMRGYRREAPGSDPALSGRRSARCLGEGGLLFDGRSEGDRSHPAAASPS